MSLLRPSGPPNNENASRMAGARRSDAAPPGNETPGSRPSKPGTESTKLSREYRCDSAFARNHICSRRLFPFTRSGFSHELLRQSGPVCLVERSRNGFSHFEVFILQRHKEQTWPNGTITPPGWHYPSSHDWGERGWTNTTIEKARERFARLARKPGRQTRKPGVKTFPRVKIPDQQSNAPLAQTAQEVA
jgi:hypothetical protein